LAVEALVWLANAAAAADVIVTMETEGRYRRHVRIEMVVLFNLLNVKNEPLNI